jgi:hypothetical protein
MTVKQIAEAVGKTERSVRNWVTAVAEKSSVMAEKISSSTSTHPADYTLEETCAIIQHGMGKNAADLYRMSAQAAPTVPEKKQVRDDRMDRVERMLEKLVSVIFAQVVTKQTGQINAPAQLGAPLTDLQPLDMRSQFRDAIHEARISTGEEYGVLYNRVYRELKNRARVDVHTLARNRGTSAIEETERAGLLPLAVQIAEAMV